MKHIKTPIFLIALCLVLASCQQLTQSFQQTITPVPILQKNKKAQQRLYKNRGKEKTPYKGLYASGELLDSIKTALVSLPELKGHQVRVYAHIVFYDFKGGLIKIDVQDPEDPGKIRKYTYKKVTGWQKPTTVKLNVGPEELALKLIPLDQIRFSVAKKVFDQIMDEVKYLKTDDSVKFVNFFYYAQSKPQGRWTASIWQNGSYVDYSFDLEGKLLKKEE